ncbi:MAG TPA: 50S ribosomal protein L11 methyltransferase [Verrucomicrobiae bacterium]|nr:50S ribosomal protein L11 methyltransferase [Verrucomicrobiae bacterium]
MKPLWKISVATTPEAEDAVAELLGTIFGTAVSAYFDVETRASTVSAYFSEKKFSSREVREEIQSGLKRIEDCGLKTGAGKISIAKIRREDWAESWKRHFHPIEIGRSLLIKPSWSKKRPRNGQAVVILDPSLSFGTGQHPTTLFCLREIARCRKIGARQSFLDIGCGSGILAIAAAKLGYTPVCRFDFDSEAVRVARANAKVNGVLQKIKIARGDVTKLAASPKQRFDLVCANLISDLLIAESWKIAVQLKPGGVLVLAGILKSEFAGVRRAFEALNLKLISARSEKGWRSGSFGRAEKFFERTAGCASLTL